MSSDFNGFPCELEMFLPELHFNNTIAKQSEIKEKYKQIITQPLMLLYEALVPTVLKIDDGFETRPSRCISSPYADRRFSLGVPFKEYMYIRFRLCGKREDILGLYFDMGADYYSYGLRIYKQTSNGMAILRQKAAENSKAYDLVLEKIMDKGFSLVGEKYKKERFPDLTESSVKDLIDRKRFYISHDVAVNKSIYTPELAEEIKTGFVQMKDIVELLKR